MKVNFATRVHFQLYTEMMDFKFQKGSWTVFLKLVVF